MIAQPKPHADNEWLLTEAVGPEAIMQIAALSVVLDLNEVYEQVELPISPKPAIPRDLSSQ